MYAIRSYYELKGNVRFAYGDNVLDTCELSYNLNERSYSTPSYNFV